MLFKSLSKWWASAIGWPVLSHESSAKKQLVAICDTEANKTFLYETHWDSLAKDDLRIAISSRLWGANCSKHTKMAFHVKSKHVLTKSVSDEIASRVSEIIYLRNWTIDSLFEELTKYFISKQRRFIPKLDELHQMDWWVASIPERILNYDLGYLCRHFRELLPLFLGWLLVWWNSQWRWQTLFAKFQDGVTCGYSKNTCLLVVIESKLWEWWEIQIWLKWSKRID